MGGFALSPEKQEVIEFLHNQGNLCVLCASVVSIFLSLEKDAAATTVRGYPGDHLPASGSRLLSALVVL
jgi:hypothetical protein